MLILLSLALAAEPTLLVRWSGGTARLEVTPPPGEHVNEEALGSFTNGSAEVRGLGSLSWARLPVSAAGLDLTAEIPLCDDASSYCRVVTGQARLARPGKTGRLVLGTDAVDVAEPRPQANAVRLLDFAAVWCPPCNQLRAEVLDDPADAHFFTAMPVEVVDVDQPASWPLKSRYHVGGYPTLVAVDARGGEVDRYVGYGGEASLRAWLVGLDAVTPIAALEAGPPPGADAAIAGTHALRLVRAQRDVAARAWLVAAGDDVAAHHARLLLEKSRADAEWLVSHDPGGAWIPDALEAYPGLWARVAPHVSELDTVGVVAALDAYAGIAPAEAALVARVAQAALLRTQMGAEPETRRGYIVELTDTLAQVGNLPGALALLDEYATRYPGEFTFDHAAARLLLDGKRFAEAEGRARRALSTAWGDQRLRAVQHLAKALDGLGRRPEALSVLRVELAAAPRPGPDDEVRTGRYLTQVETLVRELGG
ncbi:MAG: thioredoxin family protein [Myxococcales bacterium]|nr:thioredoxin family protein [Myxococcales bacterium]